MSVPFPLYRIPRLALILVFKFMQPLDVITISLVSKKSYNFSKILSKLKVGAINLIVDGDDLRISGEPELNIRFNAVGAADMGDTMMRNNGLSAFQWLERCLGVMSIDSIEEVYLGGNPKSDVCDMLALLINLRKLYVMFDCSDKFATKALGILSSVTKDVTLFKIPFASREEFRNFLKNDLYYVNIQASNFSHFNFSLEDLKVANAMKLNLNYGKLTVKGINQLFKIWVENGFDSTMEHLELCICEQVKEMDILQGLNATAFPEERRRAFLYSKQPEKPSFSFSGGHDLKRPDGKKATIQFVGLWGPSFINFFIWP